MSQEPGAPSIPSPAPRAGAQSPEPGARSPEALSALARSFVAFLPEANEGQLADIAYTTQIGRTHFEHRLAVAGDSTAAWTEKLGAVVRGEKGARRVPAGVTHTRAKVAFLFPGQGPELAQVANELFGRQPVFTATLRTCAEIVATELERPLLEVMLDPTHELSRDVRYVQPALFAFQVAPLPLLK